MDKGTYEAFWRALTTALEVPLRDFEKPHFFEGCLPIEIMAKRGIRTLTFGPHEARWSGGSENRATAVRGLSNSGVKIWQETSSTWSVSRLN